MHMVIMSIVIDCRNRRKIENTIVIMQNMYNLENSKPKSEQPA